MFRSQENSTLPAIIFLASLDQATWSSSSCRLYISIKVPRRSMSSSTICLVQTHTPSYSSWSLISYPLLTTTNFPMSPTFVPSKLQTIAAVVLILSSSFFGVKAVPIDVFSASTSDTPSRHSHVDSSATNSSSPSRHSHMDAHENAKRADFLLGYTYVNTVSYTLNID